MDVFVTIDSAGAAGVKVSINRPVADGYCAALRELAQSYGLSDDISVSLLSRFPDVLLVEKEEEDAEQVAQDISAVMEQALSDFDRMRSREDVYKRQSSSPTGSCGILLGTTAPSAACQPEGWPCS